jgi:iron complex transport system substrate-binding protein
LGVLSGCREQAEVADAIEVQEDIQEVVEEDVESAEVEEEAEEEDEAEEAIEVTDGQGNLISLDAAAEKVIVMAPSVLEIMDGLGAMDKVAEIDGFTVMMQEPLAEGFEGVGDYQSLNVEKIAEIDPDLVIAITGGPEDDYNKVAELGIPIYRVIDVSGMEGIYEEIQNVGELIGLSDEGAAMIADLKNQVDEIAGKVEGLTDDERPTVFYEVWNDPLMSAGTDTFISALIETAGGINILSADELTGWPEYSVETLIERNPDIIIAPMSLASDPTVITGDERFSSIDAVVNGKVFVIGDNQISRPSQNIIKGLQMLAKAIHPDIFGEFEIIE